MFFLLVLGLWAALCRTAVDHVLAMAFDDPAMNDDLRQIPIAHEIGLDSELPDIR